MVIILLIISNSDSSQFKPTLERGLKNIDVIADCYSKHEKLSGTAKNAPFTVAFTLTFKCKLFFERNVSRDAVRNGLLLHQVCITDLTSPILYYY